MGKMLNALAGALVAVFLGFVPFSTVLGGAVAGYLNGEDGVPTGALAGLLAVAPLVALASVFGLGAVVLPPGLSDVGGVLSVLVGLVVVFYGILPGALGGWLGATLAGD